MAENNACGRHGQREGVLLLHGLMRTSLSMYPVARHLQKSGYVVANINYPSRTAPIEELARKAISPALNRLREQRVSKIHAVTHSMGGILLRSYMEMEDIQDFGRAVMLCPPNRGSELMDVFGRFFWFRKVFGPASLELSTREWSFVNRLPSLDYPVGVLTGNRPATPLFSRYFSGENDGKVAVDRAYVRGVKAFLILPYGHSFIMFHRSVHNQVRHYLQNGCFFPVS
ncbi:esterase/lipase family protein [Desulfogranum japonicum]|uniref:esterase/lipase family protein n=1 Tax=Desulfogranum japonicum TaxID=231447 RepID=UPI00041F4E56|nr:alpha/beta fold hydrolase [Desulfogranum japonicum]